ncbi:Hsp20/alpha crystallin family protein [Pedobacter caeni]|uniref:Heat shock protein Hsp20 n=1 Tax=Pedobacter caeni TaxID=288992 RepID=A0A1M5BCF6_9SPHI|nr:Hsp20/alpha crystallin family protein [Pedobacter caeni]SHF40140.1 heat shock protein Hsp20 [Pedobacter caeni]
MKTLVKSNGFPSFRSMMADFWNADGFFNKSVFDNEFLPAVNIRDKEGSYELELSAPGFKKEDFKVSTGDGMLTISAETSKENEEENEDYTRKEFSKSSFSRSFNLPENVSEEQVKAKYSDGLLQIVLKKSGAGKKKEKQIAID